jgi:serine/threonine-protein kinase
MSGTTGDQQVGSYRILQPLGTGGMSSVYRAVHVDSGHEVAIKVLTRTLARNSTLLQRFLREAKSAEALVHPNIVSIFDRGIDLGRHYIVLEYVGGGDFHEYVRTHGPLAAPAAVSVIKDIALGLKYAASQGLIHRDIKPSNILRSSAGQVKIIDLGLALHSDFEDERVTREGTTVGTVDYMAPEQARDSRAASVQSDIYSLGCTFYYLLTGIPPYPGGDITDKLTRHARAAVPNVADLRPDVSPRLAATIVRMMAKLPEDRFGSYDELIAALDETQVDEMDQLAGYALAPSDEAEDSELRDLPVLLEESNDAKAFSADLSLGSIPVVPVENNADHVPLDSDPSLALARSVSESAPPIRRLDRLGGADQEPAEDAYAEPVAAPKASTSVSASMWIIGCLSLGIAGILIFMGWIQYLDSNASVDGAGTAEKGFAPDIEPAVAEPMVRHENRVREADKRPAPAQTARKVVGPASSHRNEPSAVWEEPVDREGDLPRPGELLSNLDRGPEQLPDWARSPIPNHVDGPFVVVRRIVEPGDSQTVPELHMALDRYVGGTVELADEGPLYEDDFRVAGESRLLRARPGCRSIVAIQGGHIEAVRQQPAVIVLDRKNLILDGIDLIVNMRDLASRQSALFSCTGANLTLKNCTVTILNPTREAFAFIRVEPSGERPSNIRLERTLVRGWFSSGVDIEEAQTDVVADKSVFLSGSGPLVRVSEPPTSTQQRFYFLDTVLAGTGPIIDRAKIANRPQPKPLIVRAYGSTFGRLHGTGIASVVCSSDEGAAAARQLEWKGNHNLFAGWMGFFAHGPDARIEIANLAAVRSTWNATEAASQEIPHPWRLQSDVSTATAGELTKFLPNRDAALRQVARPRSGLLEKTVFAYAFPLIPEPISKAPEKNRVNSPNRAPVRGVQAELPEVHNLALPKSSKLASTPAADRDVLDLTFDTASPPWNGNLGAFLRDNLGQGVRYARVRVFGSGNHRFSAVRLPGSIQLEVRVEPSDVDRPSWSPDPLATGPGLIELQGGALVLLNFVMHHDPASRLEHLIHVEGGHLVLSQCQLTTPVSSPNLTGDLIAFRSVTTRPVPYDAKHPVFSTFVDKPVCLLLESLLITNGTALRAELGRGLIALEHSAVAAGDAAIDLLPSRVARWRFESDLHLESSTLTALRTIVRAGPWPGLAPGPDRPWLITSRNCAFIANYDRKMDSRETVLLRLDPGALIHGSVFWQAENDAADVDIFTALPEGHVQIRSSRDVEHQWVSFWGRNHIERVSGPHGAGSPATVRSRARLHPGRIEPADLVLDRDYHPGRPQLSVGADLARQGVTPRPNSGRRRRG